MLRQKLLLALLVAVAFGASLSHGFHFDDFSIASGPHWSWWQTRPLTMLSFSLNAWAGSTVLWHGVNLAAHLAATLLLYAVLLEVMPPRFALVGAALFAVHPIQSEAVAYVYARATLFSTALCLGAILLWLRDKPWLAFGVYVLALLAKEDCVTVPLVLLLIARKDKPKSPIAAMLLAASAVGLRTLTATRFTPGSGAGFTAAITAPEYLLQQGAVILRYLRLLIIPFGFTIEPEIHTRVPLALAAWVGVAVIAFFAWRWKQLWVLVGFLLLLPSSSVFPASDLAADHRMYLPMIGFATAGGMWLSRIHVKGAATVIALLTLLSISRMSVWSSEEALWTEASQRAPDEVRPLIQLARALGPDHAMDVLNRAQKLHPDDAAILTEQGRVYLEQGLFAQALASFGKVLGQQPGDPHALNNRGVALRALGQEAAARRDFEAALEKQPCFAEARDNLGWPHCE